ncbi:hypothetical protein TL16_g09713 [Triparma laevis f. inornata]|uniref:Uncharacterized protein n=1 Tax=Triparma laevis f. inornata TaxID=1714386 RepID=A0A9W7ELQ9_9STRA|nr:hypothetical protein TL16_g09713 [Triparma laevis f. inornata]
MIVHARTLLPSSKSYTPSPPSSRRSLLSKATHSALTFTTTTTLLTPTLASAELKQCKKKSNNCLSTLNTNSKWISGKSQTDASKDLLDVLQAYPSTGQNNVDGGGSKIITNNLPTSLTLEFKSSGTGNFAKYFNSGNPFTDDLIVSVGDDGNVDWSSSSRVGDSDMGVNAKRVEFIEAKLREKGWKF